MSLSPCFARTGLVGIALLLACGCLLAFALIDVQETDVDSYAALLQQRPTESQDLLPSSQQYRKGVTKDLLMGDIPGQRRRLRLSCDHSTLAFTMTEGGTPLLVETMTDVHGSIQEALYYLLPDGREVERGKEGDVRERRGREVDPVTKEELESGQPMQTIRSFEADKASLYYNTNRLLAKQVRFHQFTAAGHQLLEDTEGLTPEITGIAAGVDLKMGSGSVELRAQRFEGTLVASEEE